MSTLNSKNLESEEIIQEFQFLFDKTAEDQIDHRAHMLSFNFLSEIEKALDNKGWKRKHLAEHIGTSASYLTQLFRGDRLLNLKTIAKIENALHLKFEVFETNNFQIDLERSFELLFENEDAISENVTFDPQESYNPDIYEESFSSCVIHKLRAA